MKPQKTVIEIVKLDGKMAFREPLYPGAKSISIFHSTKARALKDKAGQVVFVDYGREFGTR